VKSNKRLIVIASGLVVLLASGAALAGLLRPSPLPVPDPIELKVPAGGEGDRRTHEGHRVDDEQESGAGTGSPRARESDGGSSANESTKDGGGVGTESEGRAGAGDDRAGND
jgi:hypothetical protein